MACNEDGYQFQCLFGEHPVCCPPNYDGLPGAPPVDLPDSLPECWVGAPGSQTALLGQLDRLLEHCGWGCVPCYDEPGSLVGDGARRGGSRWLWSDPTSRAARNAWGRAHRLVSDRPHMIYQHTEYIRGVCHDQKDHSECFGQAVCRCAGDNSAETASSGTPARCADGVLPGDPIHGLTPDEYFFIGPDWPMRPGGQLDASQGMIYCRRHQDTIFPRNHKVVVRAGSSPTATPNPVTMRSTQGKVQPRTDKVPEYTQPCIDQLLVPCCAETHPTPCEGTFYYADQSPTHYSEQPEDRAPFDELNIFENTAEFDTQHPQMQIRAADFEAKNKVLRRVRGRQFGTETFDRLDGAHLQSQTLLGQFWRIYHAPSQGVTVPQAMEEVPDVFGDCRLGVSRLPVSCQLRIERIEYDCFYLAKHIEETTPAITNWLEPHIRFRIMIDCRVTAEVSGGLAVDHSRRSPFVADPADPSVRADFIEYFDPAGRPIQVPWRTEWYGMLDAQTEPSSHEVRRQLVQGGTIDARCREVASFKFHVGGYPFFVQGADSGQRSFYRGGVRLGFATT